MAELVEIGCRDPRAGEEPREDQVEDRRLREHAAGRHPEDRLVGKVGEPDRATRVGRRALLLHPGVKSPQREQRRVERVSRVGTGSQQQVGVAQPAADGCVQLGAGTFSRGADSSRSRTRTATRIGRNARTRITPWPAATRSASRSRASGTTKGVTLTPAIVLPLDTSWPSKSVKTDTSSMLLSAWSRSTSTVKMPLISALSRAWLSTGPG